MEERKGKLEGKKREWKEQEWEKDNREHKREQDHKKEWNENPTHLVSSPSLSLIIWISLSLSLCLPWWNYSSFLLHGSTYMKQWVKGKKGAWLRKWIVEKEMEFMIESHIKENIFIIQRKRTFSSNEREHFPFQMTESRWKRKRSESERSCMREWWVEKLYFIRRREGREKRNSLGFDGWRLLVEFLRRRNPLSRFKSTTSASIPSR